MSVTRYANIKELQSFLICGQLRFSINRWHLITIYHKRYLKHFIHNYFYYSTSCFSTFYQNEKEEKTQNKTTTKINTDSCNLQVS